MASGPPSQLQPRCTATRSLGCIPHAACSMLHRAVTQPCAPTPPRRSSTRRSRSPRSAPPHPYALHRLEPQDRHAPVHAAESGTLQNAAMRAMQPLQACGPFPVRPSAAPLVLRVGARGALPRLLSALHSREYSAPVEAAGSTAHLVCSTLTAAGRAGGGAVGLGRAARRAHRWRTWHRARRCGRP